jgi:hypothetical protein
MSTAKKMELAPDEIYLQAALKEGWATVQQVSMKAMGKPDTAFQARVNHLNMDHVHRLAGCYDLDGKLSPVVIFRAVDGRKTRMILADGFHRHEVYRRKGVPAIRAYVIDVAMDRIEHEARLFASMCNQVTLLARTDEDKRKAVELLFADPEAWVWGDSRVGNHCGVSPKTVTRCRSEYMRVNNIKPPEKVLKSDGTWTVYRHNKGDYPIGDGYKVKNGYTVFATQINRKRVYLGTTKESAKLKIETIKKDLDIRRRILVTYNSIQDFLMTRGFLFKSCFPIIGGTFCKYISGCYGYNLIYVTVVFQDKRDIPAAIGSLRLLRLKMNMPDARLVVLCYPEDGPQDLIELARQDGIEFFTPEGLVANLKGTEPQEEKQSEGGPPCT